MDPISAIMLLSTLVGVGSKIYKSKKQNKYQKELEKFEKEQIDKSHKQQLGKAVGSVMPAYTPFAPRKQDAAPETPDTSTADMIEGVASGIGAFAGSSIGRETSTLESTNPYDNWLRRNKLTQTPYVDPISKGKEYGSAKELWSTL